MWWRGAPLGGGLDRFGLIAVACAAGLVGLEAHAADPGATDAPPTLTPPAPALTASVSNDAFLSQTAALNAAVRLASPKPWRFEPDTPAAGASTPAAVTLRYRLMPTAPLSPYIGGSLITPDALAGVNRGGLSLNLKNGASVAMGFDTDQNGQAKLKFDMGLQQAFTPAPTYDHKSYNPMIVGAGVGLKF